MTARQRLDAAMVRRGLVHSRVDAARLIDEGRVHVNGAVADKAARLVAPDDALHVIGPPARFVGRGGDKLDAALDTFGISMRGRRVLDAGASTGGFTDCLLQRGARTVIAVDVGHGQLHERLRADPRVVVLERTHVGRLAAADVGGPVEALVADLSFISLTNVLPSLVQLCQPGSSMVLLVKPQFEVGRVDASRGRGVIDDPCVRAMATSKVADALVAAGCTVEGWRRSPIAGASGNVEFLVHARTPAGERG